jgi:phosphodiesterase/alkaline phosphatase D-like protein
LILLALGSFQVFGQQIIRSPYLQMLGDKSVQIRYRTNQAIISEVQVSSDGKTFNRIKKSSQTNTEHLVLIDSLTASNKYFYRIRLTSTQFAGDSTYFFKTAPAIGSQEKFSVWTIGDMYPGPNQKNVYEGFKKFIGNKYINLFLTQGDNV